jgi:uncharacterized iron-regulated protein
VTLVADPPRALVGGAAEDALTPGALESAVDAARVVLVGEAHDQRSHHIFQRDLLARMASGGGPLLLGMEMFQRPFQEPLDAYVAGEIDELEMLRRTEYATRWSMDHTMYAPLWRLCREHGIRIVALNPAREVHQKLRKEGLDALTAEERTGLAAEIDLAQEAHRKRLIDVLQKVHPSPPDVAEKFYVAQTAWDETMAESAARALDEAGPDSRMLIVAGSQHIQEFDGVAARLARRLPGLEPLVVVCRTAGQDEDGDTPPEKLGHFVVAMTPAALREAPKLGVGLGDPTDAGLPITSVVPGGLAERAGLVAGDVVRTLAVPGEDPVALRDLMDFKYVLAEAYSRVGTMELSATRADGSELSLTLDLRAAPPPPEPQPAPPAPEAPAAPEQPAPSEPSAPPPAKP